MTRRLLTYFFRGLVFLAPVALTLYICTAIFRTIDGFLGLPIPGAGFALTVALITLFGFFASSLISRSFIAAFDALLNRLPFVRLLYSSTRDLVNAFVGEKRRFDRPVLVRPTANSELRVVGFLTSDGLPSLGMPDAVSVYVPQSYGFAGQLLVVPRAQVERLPAPSSEVMAYIISGGVSAVRRPDEPTGT